MSSVYSIHSYTLINVEHIKKIVSAYNTTHIHICQRMPNILLLYIRVCEHTLAYVDAICCRVTAFLYIMNVVQLMPLGSKFTPPQEPSDFYHFLVQKYMENLSCL